MIGVFDLEVLLKSYGINCDNILDNNDKILSMGEYLGIKKVLDYLVLEIGLPIKNIEKCPSILYYNVDAVCTNYEYLRSTGITIDNVNNCLHILSTDPVDLSACYEYVLNNYGLEVLNKQTSI